MSTVALIDNFVTNLVAHCEKEGISWAELARRSGIHFVTISRIINRHISPTVDTCEKLAAGAGMKPDKVFRDSEKVA